MNSYTVNQRMELVSKYMNGNYKSQRHFCEEESIANSTFSGWIKSYNENKLQPVSDDNRRVRLRKKSTGEFDPNLIDYKRPKLNVRLIPMMAIDFIESSTSYVIRAEVAGVAEEGIDISIEKDILRIRATKKEMLV